jgi:DNA mismatch endonuclease, patch repair protein
MRTDIFSQKKRSEVMSRIRASGNRDTELRMIALLKENRIMGWRRHMPVFGKPDFLFPRERVAVFIDGCFWHRHKGCRFSYTPKSRSEFWLPKFERNIARDRLVTRKLRKDGWRVMRVWECQLSRKKQSRILQRLKAVLDLR